MPSMTLLNQHGDVTILWEDSADEALLEVIRKKMAEGVVFFILEPQAGGFAPPKKTALKEPEQALKNRAISIADEHLEAFVGTGKATVVKATGTRRKTGKRATTAEEVVTNDTVAVKQRRGG